MKQEHVYNLVRLTIVLFVVLFVAFTLWSVNNVIQYFWKDGMRVFVIGAGVVSFTALLFLHAKNAIAKRNKSYLLATGIVGFVFLVITLAFVFLDYTINQFNTFDKLDSRLQTSVSIAVWITSVVLLVCSFGLAVWHKAVYKKEMPVEIIIAELLTSFFCIWANAWGTSDAVFKLTQDLFSANAMAIFIDFMIFLMGAWYLIANDKATSAITKWTVIGGVGVTTVLQITDGILAGANIQTTEQIVNIAQFAFPVTFFLSFGLVVTTFFIDHFNGGLSIIKPNTETESDEPEPRAHRPLRQPQRPQHDLPTRPTLPDGQQRVRANPTGFAEPDGLSEESVAALKELGWSSGAIAKFTQEVADEAVEKGILAPKFSGKQNEVTPKMYASLLTLGYPVDVIEQMRYPEAVGRIGNNVRYKPNSENGRKDYVKLERDAPKK